MARLTLGFVSRFLVPSLFACAGLTGCGGGGGSSETVSLSASPRSISYGATSTISWSSTGVPTSGSSNFGVDSSNFASGSITDTPGTTTTYALSMLTSSGNTARSSATVTVAKATGGVLVVGDSAQAGPNQMVGFARTLASGTVQVSSSIPDPTAAYPVLYVSETAPYTSSLKDQAKKWLDAGKGVILCGTSPRLLASGDLNNADVSAIGSWFFGVTDSSQAIYLGGTVRSSSGSVALSAVLRGKEVDPQDENSSISGYGPQVDALVISGSVAKMAVYAVPSGGRLVYSCSPVGYGANSDGLYRQAFESAFHWAAQ